MSLDPDTALTRIEHALARIEQAATRSRSDGARGGDAKNDARRTKTVAALAELDRVIARLAGEAR